MGLLLRKSRLSNKWAGQDSKRAPGSFLPAWSQAASKGMGNHREAQETRQPYEIHDGLKALPDEISTALTISEAGIQEPCPCWRP